MIFSEQALWLALNMILFGEGMAGLIACRTKLDTALCGLGTFFASMGVVSCILRLLHP